MTRLRTLGHTGVRWWFSNRTLEISLLSDLVFCTVAVTEGLRGDVGKEPARIRSAGQRRRSGEDIIGELNQNGTQAYCAGEGHQSLSILGHVCPRCQHEVGARSRRADVTGFGSMRVRHVW